MVTAIFVLGWVWSIMWGINFIKRKIMPPLPILMFFPTDSSMESEEFLYPDHRESFEISSNTASVFSTNINGNSHVNYIKEANSV